MTKTNRKNAPEHLRALYKSWDWHDIQRKLWKKYSYNDGEICGCLRSYARSKKLSAYLRETYSAK